MPFGTRQTYRLASGVRVALKSVSLSCSERTTLCSLHSKKRDPSQSGGRATGQLALFASPLIVYNLHPYHLTRRLESVYNLQLCTETFKRGGDQTYTGESWEVGWGASKIIEPQHWGQTVMELVPHFIPGTGSPQPPGSPVHPWEKAEGAVSWE